MKTIGVYTSGGDSPGMNAAIRAVVRSAIAKNIKVVGIRSGYEGMIAGDFINLGTTQVANIIQKGGTILKTARSEKFLTVEGRIKAAEQLKKQQIEGLVCIGGNGSYTGAQVFYEEHGISVIGLPGTIDNDIFSTDFSIGFQTAVNTAMEAIDKIRDTAESHNRVFVVEVMGRHSGYLAIEVGIACGAEVILLPESKTDTQQLYQHFRNEKKRKKSFSIVVVAEGDEAGGAIKVAEKMSNSFPNLSIRTTILGHIQRGGNPCAFDRILASKLGDAAVTALVSGKSGVALGWVNHQVNEVPIPIAIAKQNPVPKDYLELVERLSK